MKQIAEGIFVEEMDEYRSYLIEADYSEHIKKITSKESAEQEIQLREGAPAQEILEFVIDHDYEAELADSEMIFVETVEPTKLVNDLCKEGYIDVEQATAIIVHEIEHIRNPKMREKVKGQKGLKEVREIVIQYKLDYENAKKAQDVSGGKNSKNTSKTR